MREDLFQSVRKLARLRAAAPALRRGVLTSLLVEDDAYAFARVTDGSRRRDLSVSGLRSLSLRYDLGGQYPLCDHHFGAAEERYREAYVGDTRKGRSVYQLSVAHNVDAPPTGG